MCVICGLAGRQWFAPRLAIRNLSSAIHNGRAGGIRWALPGLTAYKRPPMVSHNRGEVRTVHLRILFSGMVLCSWVGLSHGQLADQVPEGLNDVGVEEHLDAQLPMDLELSLIHI